MFKTVLFGATCFVAVCAANAWAQPTGAAFDKNFSGVNEIRISEFTGRVELVVRDGPVSVKLSDGEDAGLVTFEQTDGVLTVAAPHRPDRNREYNKVSRRTHGADALAVFLADYPTLKISAPAGAALDLDDLYSIAAIGDTKGALTIRGGLLDAAIGDIDTGDVTLASSRDIGIGAVSRELRARIAGSGDIKVAAAGAADLTIAGSGDIKLGDVGGDTAAAISGSGDIAIGDIDGALTAKVNGSGDITTGDVGGGGVFTVSGSGDIAAHSIHGPASARIAGSGDVKIDAGRAENLHISINGSGDFIFGGVSTNLSAATEGSGSVEIGRNEGSLTLTGHGHFRINGAPIKKNDD